MEALLLGLGAVGDLFKRKVDTSTYFDWAVFQEHLERIIPDANEAMVAKRRTLQLLQSTNGDLLPIIRKLLSERQPKLVQALLPSSICTQEVRDDLVSDLFYNERESLVYLTKEATVDILSYATPHGRLKAIMRENRTNTFGSDFDSPWPFDPSFTTLMVLILSDCGDTIEGLLATVDSENYLEILIVNKAVETAVLMNKLIALDALLKSVESDAVCYQQFVNDGHCLQPLETAFDIGNEQAIAILQRFLKPGTFLEIIESMTGELTKSELFKRFLTDAKVNFVARTSEVIKSGRILNDLERNECVTVSHLARLLDQSTHYIFPRLPSRFGLVLFNNEQRDRAMEEAAKMEQGLVKAGFSTRRQQWSNALELPQVIDRQLDDMTNQLSLLFICIMSHGRAGMLEGSHSSAIPISDVLHILKTRLPQHIPLVIVVQACQEFLTPTSSRGQQSFDAGRGHPQDCKHIVLDRPHTLLLMATIVGDRAERGSYTGALAEQISRADGKTTILEMETRARIEMMNENPQQTSEMRNTLKRSLILPCPANG